MGNAKDGQAFIPSTEKKRIIIAGGGFGGLKLARRLTGKNYQVVLIDRHNYHQFQPLLYQVATAGLEPSSISFPLRKIFQNKPDLHFRMTSLLKIDPAGKKIVTDIGLMKYDFLVLAMGVNTNFLGIDSIEKNTIPMKTVSESIYLRNKILMNFEKALNLSGNEDIDPLLNYVIVGGGPTGVELAGALAEMKKYVLPKDYPELDSSRMQIHLLEAAPQLLSGMSDKSAKVAQHYLEDLGVDIRFKAFVTGYDGNRISIKDSDPLESKTVIWAAGVKGEKISGLPEDSFDKLRRVKVDQYNRLPAFPDIFAIGDMASMVTKDYPKGHPQLAQVAIQQGIHLSKNLKRMANGHTPEIFRYKHKGSLATVGRKLAVADLPGIRLKGFSAWFVWLVVHIMQLVGIKNRFFVFMNWWWNYVLYSQSLRLLIRPKLFRYQEKISE
ncbi:MAG: NAD(P)/FAD-dependent oxidoreductase [Bacteroidales bacterium]|nr:NAD(P)/FAD-dependent oxidoreductase [Bacteroidales bacterium]